MAFNNAIGMRLNQGAHKTIKQVWNGFKITKNVYQSQL
jgi:hypothetical protein